ncbi:MAG: hypothetical protein ACTSYA_00720 [Candidatus Kariarchaeaceae archaeon]
MIRKKVHFSFVIFLSIALLFSSNLPVQTFADDDILAITGNLGIDSYTMAELIAVDEYQGYGGYIRTTGSIEGPHEYTGVSVLSILEDLGYPLDNYSVEMVASDGYTLSYNQDLVEGNVETFDLNGVSLGMDNLIFVLGYEEIGEAELSGGPLRVMFLSEDDSIVTTGSLWAKYVVQMNVKDAQGDWVLTVDGLSDFVFPRMEIEAIASCYHHFTYLIVDGHNYSGVPLWIILSTGDGAELIEDGEYHHEFNAILAQENYNITFTNIELKSVEIGSLMVSNAYMEYFNALALNDDAAQLVAKQKVFLANEMDGEPLEGDYPLKLVGTEIETKDQLGQIFIVEISLDPLETTPSGDSPFLFWTGASVSSFLVLISVRRRRN